MYEIRSEAVKTFITTNIQLPRFQRKQTWDEKKNFQLCISVFKGYPIGVCIINIEKEKTGLKKYLLDGRQRRNALTAIYENPEIIGEWAKKYLGFKNNISEYDLIDLYRDKINEYLEEDDNSGSSTEKGSDEIKEAAETDETFYDEDFDEETLEEVDSSGLDLLLKIVLLSYKKGKHTTGFTAPFDFSKYIRMTDYVDMDSEKVYKINGKKVKNFIDVYRRYCQLDEKEYDNWETFAEFVLSRGSLLDGKNNETKLKEKIESIWQDIFERIQIVNDIDELLTNCKIGLIEVQGFKPADSQKIFNIINSEGVKLTAAEILSAKSYWNKEVSNPSKDMMDTAKELYDNMNIKIDSVYRWDIPATLLSRIGDNIIFKAMSWDSLKNKAEFEKKLTLGFKIFAGIYEKGIKKENIDNMGKDPKIDWDTQSEQTILDIKSILKLIDEIDYFKYLKSWKTTIMELTSDAVALDFLLVLYFDWIKKGKPVGSGTKTKQFQKNCIILWDQLIYEYVNKQWRGSSDSKIANNIKGINMLGDVFDPIDESKWTSMLKEIRDNSTINGDDIKKDIMSPILYHMYCMKKMSGPSGKCTIEVDHIIPQSLFSSSPITRKDVVKDNLFNLGLLPKKENISKSNLKLTQIDSDWLKTQIKEYEFIEEKDYAEYSNISNYSKLFDYIKKTAYDTTFTTTRTDLLNN